MIDVKAVFRERTSDLPLLFYGNWQGFCPQFEAYALNIVFVFRTIKRASTIYEETTFAQGGPNVRNNFKLPLCTEIYILFAPLINGSRIFSEHTFAGAGHICRNDVEASGQV